MMLLADACISEMKRLIGALNNRSKKINWTRGSIQPAAKSGETCKVSLLTPTTPLMLEIIFPDLSWMFALPVIVSKK
jgi:hypothetical protein